MNSVQFALSQRDGVTFVQGIVVGRVGMPDELRPPVWPWIYTSPSGTRYDCRTKAEGRLEVVPDDIERLVDERWGEISIRKRGVRVVEAADRYREGLIEACGLLLNVVHIVECMHEDLPDIPCDNCAIRRFLGEVDDERT